MTSGAPLATPRRRAAAAGRGLAVEVSAAVLDHVFLTLGHAGVVAATDPPNTASRRVTEKLGMTCERRGLLRGLDTVFYRLDARDHRRRRSIGQACPVHISHLASTHVECCAAPLSVDL